MKVSFMIKHKHHIIPRHIGGTDDPSNIIELTIEEHAEAHRILYEQHGRWQDKLAWQGLAGLIGKDELLAELCSSKGERHPFFGKNRTDATKQKISEKLNGHPVSDETRTLWKDQRVGKTHTEETKKKISESNKGKVIPEWHKEILRRPKSEEHKRKIREANTGKKRSEEIRKKNRLARLGKTHSEETKKLMSDKLKGRKISWDLNNTTPEANEKRSQTMRGKSKPVLQCMHCGKIGGAPQMKQWHFDNCKEKK